MATHKRAEATRTTLSTSATVATLARIEKVEIRHRIKRNGRGSYVMDVYFRPESLPLRHSLINKRDLFQRAEAPRVSDYHLDRGYGDFMALRCLLRFLSKCEHEKKGATDGCCSKCGYCGPLHAFLANEWWLPSATLRVVTTADTKMRTLESFVNRLLQLVLALPESNPHCIALSHITSALQRFLQPRSNDTLGII